MSETQVQAEASDWMKRQEAQEKAEMQAAGVPDEKALRESEAPAPKTPKELADYVYSLTNRPHSYGTCVYAMSLAATAAFNHVAHALGVTGFQAGCADMDVIRRTRGFKGPFAIIDANHMLYPQYAMRGDFEKTLEKWKPWAREEAKKLIAEHKDSEFQPHPNVLAHWHRLAEES